MWILYFYRFYFSILFGILFYLYGIRSIWAGISCVILIRLLWFFIERIIIRINIERNFKKHISEFKQHHGPYGIRIANKAEKEWRVKESLSEVFASDRKKLEKTVEQLEALDALFNAGMRPEGDEFLLHDLKLKYGKLRLERD